MRLVPQISEMAVVSRRHVLYARFLWPNKVTYIVLGEGGAVEVDVQ